LIVAPLHNESDRLARFVEAVGNLRRLLPTSQYEVRLCLVEDGSTDDTFAQLQRLSASHDWIGHVRFTANFGHQAALIGGLTELGPWADAVVTMDADLEHPVEIIPQLLSHWEQGCVVVNTVRRDHPELAWGKRLPSRLFYRLTALLTGLTIVPGQADFRLWDADVIRSLKEYLPNIGSLRVFAAWMPGRKAHVEFDQKVIPGRQSRFTFARNWEMAMISIMRFSQFPLRAITWIGVIGVVVSAAHALQIIYAISRGEPMVAGWVTLILSIIFMGCLQLISLGILASYLRRLVFSKDLPLFLVKSRKSVDQ
jgi:dolichol-phosphate mannosyltransferase